MDGVSEHLNLVSSSEDYKRLGCPYVQLECIHCKEKCERRVILDHEQNSCLQRPFRCTCCDEYESTFEDVTTTHTSVCPDLLLPCPNDCGESLKRKEIDNHRATNCPLEVIKCSFSYAGCKEECPRRDMPTHISESLAVHMSLQAINHQQQLEKLESHIQKLENQVQDIQKEVTSLKSQSDKEDLSFVRAHLQIMPVNLVMNGYELKKTSGKSWTSMPFFTHPRGYKMCLRVDANGTDGGVGTHVSVFLYLMSGEYDNELEWPFQGRISIQLLNQEEPRRHYEMRLNFAEAPAESTRRVTDSDKNSTGWGLPRFITHSVLNVVPKLKYLKNDSLFFKISKCPP